MDDQLPERATSASSALSVVGGLSTPVTRGTYLAVGASLMVLKYAVEAGAIAAVTGAFLTPAIYLTPLITLREGVMAGAPEWLWVSLLLWNLPFAWIGGTMSVRRARDAGLHPAMGLLFFVPFVNFLAMAGLAALPTRARVREPGPLRGPERSVAAALVGVAGGAAVATGMTTLSTLVLGAYGGGLFIGTPFVMGAVAGLLYNLRSQQSVGSTVGVGILTTGVAGGFLLLLALEGAFCLAMAAPLLLLLGIAGAVVGRALARIESNRALTAPMMVLPLVTVAEPHIEAPPRVVTTSVMVDAPAQAVWDALIDFPEIDEDPGWPFQLGLAFPRSAQLQEPGVGGVRVCGFSTGDVVGDIVVWDPPRELVLQIRELPASMTELSPWSHVYAAHLDGNVLEGGQVRLAVEPLADGRARLTGSTHYRFHMAPIAYWGVWSDAIIGAMHDRVFADVVTRAR